MREITFFLGGSVGSDPYSPRTWSGTSLQLIQALSRRQLLKRAVGLKIPSLAQAALQFKNFARVRSVWRTHFYFDPWYRLALTRAAAAAGLDSPAALQIGGMFSLPSVFPNRKCISYNDGNLAQLVSSGFGLQGVSRTRIDQALRYEEEVANQLSVVFTFSEYLRQSFITEYRVPADRVFSVGAAANFDEIPAVSQKDYANGKLLFVGVEFARKGGPQLLQAFRRVREAHPRAELHIVGPQQLDDIPPGVVFHGRLSKQDPEQRRRLESLFRECSLFVLPSLYEPFGIAPIEAMFYQAPCLLTDGWAFREYVTPGSNGDLVEKGSVDDLAAKMTALLADPDRLAAMGAQGRELATKNFTWDAVVSRMAPHFS